MSKFRQHNDRSDELCYRCGKLAKFEQQWETDKNNMWHGWWMRFKCECGQEIDRPTGDPLPPQPDELAW